VQCKVILEIVDADLLSVTTKTFSDTSQYTKSTVRRSAHVAVAAALSAAAEFSLVPICVQVGLMVKDSVIDNMLTGAPAYMVRVDIEAESACVCPHVRARAVKLTSLRHGQSKQFQKGDVVLEVTKSPTVKLLSPLLLRTGHPA